MAAISPLSGSSSLTALPRRRDIFQLHHIVDARKSHIPNLVPLV